MFPELPGEPPQGCQVIEWILPAQATGLNDAHEEVADFCAIHRFIEQGVVGVLSATVRGGIFPWLSVKGSSVALKMRNLQTAGGPAAVA